MAVCMWHRVALALAGVLVVIASPTARGDGKGFTRVRESVVTPDQRVAIIFDGREQTLVVDTAFRTEEREAGWVVPVPSAPLIEAVGEGFFPAVRAIAGPRLEREHGPLRLAAAFLLGVLGVVGIEQLVGGGRVRGRGRGRRVLVIGAGLAALIGCAGVLLPSVSRATSEAAEVAVAGAEIVSRGRAGVYETAVIRGESGRAVVEWLELSGFYVSPGAAAVMDAYCRDGWVFAAAKVGTGADGVPDGGSSREGAGTTRPHPLAFTFATGRAVYPLRLTGVQEEACRVQAYVFGPSRARLFGLHERLAAEIIEGPAKFGLGGPARRVTNNQGVLERVKRQPVVTVLEGELSPRQMVRDAEVVWRPLGDGRDWRVWNFRGAAAMALCAGLVVGLLGSLFAVARSTLTGRVRSLVAAGSWVAAAAVGGVVFGRTEVVETERAESPWRAASSLRQIASGFVPSDASLGCAELAEELRVFLRDALRKEEARVEFDLMPSEGEGPGQYAVRCGGLGDGTLGEVELVWIGWDGWELPLRLNEPR